MKSVVVRVLTAIALPFASTPASVTSIWKASTQITRVGFSMASWMSTEPVKSIADGTMVRSTA